MSEPAGWPGVSGTRRGPRSGCYHLARGGAAAEGLQSCPPELCWCGSHPGGCRTQEQVSGDQLQGPFWAELRCANRCWSHYVLSIFNMTQCVFVLYNKFPSSELALWFLLKPGGSAQGGWLFKHQHPHHPVCWGTGMWSFLHRLINKYAHAEFLFRYNSDYHWKHVK